LDGQGPYNWGKSIAEKARRAVSPAVVMLAGMGWKEYSFGITEREVG